LSRLDPLCGKPDAATRECPDAVTGGRF